MGMTLPRGDLFNDLERFISSYGVQVRLREMDLDNAGRVRRPHHHD